MSLNNKKKNNIGLILLFIFDVLTLTGFYYIAALFRKHILPLFFSNLPAFEINLFQYYWVFPIWIFILAYEGGYTRRFSLWDEVKLLWKSSFFTALAIFAVLFIGKKGISYSRTILITMVFGSFLLFPVVRPLYKSLLHYMGFLKRKVLIIGSGEFAKKAYHSLKKERNLGYEVAGFVDDCAQNLLIEGYRVHNGLERIERYLKRCGIQDVIIAKPEMEKEELMRLIDRVQHKVENTLFIPDIVGISVLGTELRHFFQDQTLVIALKNNLERRSNFIIKRIFDYVVSISLLPFFLIIFCFLSLLIKLTSRGPAIFSQERIGKNNKPFMCYKFRTMYIDAEERLKEILNRDPEARKQWEEFRKLKKDPRITSIGRFLRKTSLDELPQLFNVLKGDMSLVGPRPVTREEIEKHYKDKAEFYFKVLPGITGLWQVSGRNDLSYDERVSLDAWYVRNWNLWLDIVILLKTVGVVIKSNGAF